MADALHARSALFGLAPPGRHGRESGPAGLVVREVAGSAIATIAARKGRAEAVMAALAERYGIRPADAPGRLARDGVAFIGAGPRQWIASAEPPAAAGFVRDLRARLAGLAAVADQSDSRVVLRLAGEHVRDVLAKGVPIDLHPDVFPPGATTATLVVHVGVQLSRLDDAETFELMAPRSMAGSFWSWLTASAAEFGYEVTI